MRTKYRKWHKYAAHHGSMHWIKGLIAQACSSNVPDTPLLPQSPKQRDEAETELLRIVNERYIAAFKEATY